MDVSEDGSGYWLPADVRARLVTQQRSHITKGEELLLQCDETRSQVYAVLKVAARPFPSDASLARRLWCARLLLPEQPVWCQMAVGTTHRSPQAQNLARGLARLQALVDRAAVPPKVRVVSAGPPANVKRRRVEEKRRHAQKKNARRSTGGADFG